MEADIKKGVKTGILCLLPTLFNIFIEETIKKNK